MTMDEQMWRGIEATMRELDNELQDLCEAPRGTLQLHEEDRRDYLLKRLHHYQSYKMPIFGARICGTYKETDRPMVHRMFPADVLAECSDPQSCCLHHEEFAK